jgi:hypothetical protein
MSRACLESDTLYERWSPDDFYVKSYAKGRRCCHDGCKTILSIYNGGETCDAHRPEPDFLTYRGKRFRICPECGQVLAVRSDKTDGPCGACKMRAVQAKVRASGQPVACTGCGVVKPQTPLYFGYSKGKRNTRCRTCEQARQRRNYARGVA